MMHMARNLGLLVVLVTAGAAAGRAQEQVEREPGRDRQQRGSQAVPRGGFTFEAMLGRHDADNDGKVAAGEFQGPPAIFKRLDQNGDGTVTEAEFDAAISRGAFRGRQPGARPQRQQAGPPAVAVPEGVELLTDVAYREGSEKCRLDLAMPRGPGDDLRPALVIVHGGGWRSGDKGGGQWRALPLEYAGKGYVAISVNYRLTGEAPFPACVEDVKCAVRWLRAHAAEYRVDPERIGAYGNSAGAHLVAMLGLAGRDAGLEGDGPYQDQSSAVQAVCCSATPTDFSDWGGGAFRGEGTLLAGPQESFAERKKKASPITHVRPDAPPFLVIHGTADGTVPLSQGEKLVEALKEAGAKDVTFLKFDGAGHGVFQQHADQTYPAMEAFFARTLKPSSAVPGGSSGESGAAD